MLIILLAIQVVGAASLTVFANTWLTSKAEGLVNIKLETEGLKTKQSVNQQAARDLDKYESTRILLEKIVPKSKDQAKTIGELLKIAEEEGVTISTMTFPASELGNSSASKTVVGTSPTAAAANTSVVTQAKPVTNIAGLLGIEVSLSQIDRVGGSTGDGVTYKQLLGFLEAIEKNRRTMQIKNLQILPLKSPTGVVSGYSLSLTMNIFVKP
jgi:hypothetical protein